MAPYMYMLFFVIIAAFFVGGGFFLKGFLEIEPRQKIKFSLYGFAFMLLGYLGNHFLRG